MSDGGSKPWAAAWLNALMACGAGSIGGLLFFWLQMPLPWMLGSMVACGLCAILGLPVSIPIAGRISMTAVIGSMLGASFTAEVLDQMGGWPIPLAGVGLYVVTCGIAGYCYFRWVARFDHPTAFFSGMPGGVVEMVTLGAERGGDERLISLIHAARIFLVVMSTPLLVGLLADLPIARGSAYWVSLETVELHAVGWFVLSLALGTAAGHLLRLPARYLLGPMLVSAVLHATGTTDFELPSSVVAVAQIVIGSNIGSRFAGVPARKILRVFAISIGSTALLLGLSLSFSMGVGYLTGLDPAALVLAYSPGGLAEMSLVALSMNVGTVFVVMHHLARVLLVVAGSTAVFGALKRCRTVEM